MMTRRIFSIVLGLAAVALPLIAEAQVAKQALPKCAIAYMDGDEMKAALEAFYAILYEYNPASIGGEIPDSAIYYEK